VAVRTIQLWSGAFVLRAVTRAIQGKRLLVAAPYLLAVARLIALSLRRIGSLLRLGRDLLALQQWVAFQFGFDE
jgi:hypothetical protein